MDHGKIEKGVRLILQGLGCDMKDRNFAATPERVSKAYAEIFTPTETEFASFEEDYSDFILLRGHELWSLCPHHLFPARFTVSIAYIPSGRVLGLSKLARVLDECNPGPVLQESFTRAAADRLSALTPGNEGVAVLVAGSHGCMQMRGVRSKGDVVTYNLTGKFLTSPQIQDRFFQLCHEGR